jgi:multicomponent Na+:H+ antiporter subunit G
MNLPVLLAALPLLLGSLLVIIGGIGVHRFPDFFTRLHAASVTETGGTYLILLGLCLLAGDFWVIAKLLLIGAFFYITNPTSAHALARAALHDGVEPQLPGRPRS